MIDKVDMSTIVNKLIFLAEDDQDDCDFFKSALNAIDHNHELAIFNDGVALMDQLQPGMQRIPDMVVMDLNMPRKNGRQCIADIRANALFNNMPIIVFSTSSWIKDVTDLYHQGADLFVVKPNTYKNLVNLINKILSIDWVTHQRSERFLIKEAALIATGVTD